MSANRRTCRVSALLLAVMIGAASSLAGATLQGSVRDSSGAAVANATVQVIPADQPLAIKTVHTDAGGNYKFSVLRPGSYKLSAEMTHFGKAASGPFSLGEGETKSMDLVLKPPAATLDFFDEPTFTVAGVTDHTYVGGHGSDSVVRSAEELTKAAASLSTGTTVDAVSSAATEHHLMADNYERQGNPLDAVREYQRAAESEASETNFFDWGTELLIHRAPEPAIEVFTKGIHLFPHSSRLLLGAAVALYGKGDYDRAAQYFFNAADLNPGDPSPYLFLAKVRTPEITGSDGFQKRLTRFAKLQPENAWANYYYATILWERRKNAEDIETLAKVQALLTKAVTLDPKLGEGYLQLGILCSEKRDLQDAIRSYQKAIELDSRMEQAHYRLAQAYRQVGETEKAQKEAEIFHELATTSAQELERERSDLKQFVVTLKTPAPH